MYQPKRLPTHHDIEIRGLNYRVNTWGDESCKPLYLLHGWADVSMAFQFIADHMEDDWYLIAPDWRGFGDTQWNNGGYWFPDYLADLEAIIKHFSPDTSIRLVGHSMGGNVAWLYAGIRPDRISHVISLDAIGLSDSVPEQAPHHYAKWLDQINSKVSFVTYPNIDKAIQQIKQLAPRLDTDRAEFLAGYWTNNSATGDYPIKHDPAHKRVNPVLYRRAEVLSCWNQITADVMLLLGRQSWVYGSYTSEGYQDEIKHNIKRFMENIIEDSGHMLHLEQPGRVAAVIDAFLRR
ncbi:MAG: alpha/beta hydrolase [Gammaproteobacteria bacterium]|nr:alpha/beta hydrolase [Gammaproteobacteria bacterium]